ncbi:thioredoxin domain-containing protein [Candidatus Poribacteria bacterium]|nr:thioredoxin domain-containing protein [Candidatus Poribacteria bacterium]
MMEEIKWLEWAPEAFERARKEDKLILLDIGAVWCHWCHVMDEESYANPDIVRFVNEHYVPIRVDNDQRPDVNDRYNQGGWPTTVILTSEGFVVHGATYLPPATVKELLKKAMEWYRDNKKRVADAAGEMAREMAREVARPTLETGSLKDFSTAIVEDIKKNADPIHGGLGTAAKFPHAGAISLSFARYSLTGDSALLEFAEKTLHNMSEGILDPVEGGLYRYSVAREWNVPHYEKNLNVNAECLQNYLDAYRITGKEEYANTARKIIRYLQETLSDKERGGFYGSQDADIFDEEKMKIEMDGEDYYKLPLEERTKHGVPFIDKTIFTNWNALAVSAFLDAYHVLGLDECRDFALKTLGLLMEHCSDEEVGTYHFLRDGTTDGPGMLGDSVALARANLYAYETAGDAKYLENARRLMDVVVMRLNAPDGGFYDSVMAEKMPPATRIRHKPMTENALAAEVFVRLHSYTMNSEYLDHAMTTLSAFDRNVEALLARDVGYFASDLAVASHYADTTLTKVTVVGRRDDHRSINLVHEAKRIYRPAKTVQLLDTVEDKTLIDEMNFQVADSPVAYVCADRKCSAPVKTPKKLRETLESLRAFS